MKESELNLLLGMLPAYISHFKKNPKSIIAKIFGVYTFETGENLGKEQYHLLVMKNINGYPSKNVNRAYDLKGSTVGRKTIKQEGEFSVNEIGKFGTLKDLDFLEYDKEIKINTEYKKPLTDIIATDVAFLEAHGLIDYSFLVLLVDHEMKVPMRRTISVRKPELKRISEVTDEDFQTQENEKNEDEDKPFLRMATAKEPGDVSGVDFTMLKSTEERLYYHIGIIDYLIEFNMKKKAEVFFKKLIALNPNLNISVQRPSFYAARFKNFATKIIMGEDPENEDFV